MYPRQVQADPLGFVGHLENGIESFYEPLVVGKIPTGLVGTFYRNGPGIYSRANGRKGSIVDGDGFIRMYQFADGKVSYRGRLVQTTKLVEETNAAKFLYSTWTSPAPEHGWPTTLSYPNQAGVTTVVRNGKLYAHDEMNPPWILDPNTLESIAPGNLHGINPKGIKAHFRVDSKTNEWILFDTVFNTLTPSHSIYIVSQDGASTSKITLSVSRQVPLSYMHDFFVTKSSVMLYLQPAFPDYEKLAKGIPFGKTLSWGADEPTKLAIISRAGDVEPIIVETPSNWMWHSANAYDRGNEIVADYVGYEQPDHFFEIDGNEPAWFAFMKNRAGSFKYPGKLRRLIINKATKTAREEILDGGNNEVPVTDKRVHCYEHRNIYYIQAPSGALWWSKIMCFDSITGAADGYDFGPGYYLNEPSFAADKNVSTNLAKSDAGWILVPVFELAAGVSSLAIFRAEGLSDGPIASVRLRTHDPFAFHGYWHPT
jgi:all-trans-8'-apo-beta-carotenal 15,15'-oxygenase